MVRAIGAVIVGYLVMVVVVFSTFSVAYLGMGADRAFRPGTYDVTALWSVVSFALGLLAAVAGGWMCAFLAKGGKAPIALATVVLVLGILLALPVLLGADAAPVERTADVGNLEAMQKAKKPAWSAVVNPILGVLGVLWGARLRRKQGTGAV